MELVQSDTFVFQHPVSPANIYGPKVFLLTKIKPEYSNILYNPTHIPDTLVCRIGQVLLYLFHTFVCWIVRQYKSHYSNLRVTTSGIAWDLYIHWCGGICNSSNLCHTCKFLRVYHIDNHEYHKHCQNKFGDHFPVLSGVEI
jgi:hypothetical protein